MNSETRAHLPVPKDRGPVKAAQAKLVQDKVVVQDRADRDKLDVDQDKVVDQVRAVRDLEANAKVVDQDKAVNDKVGQDLEANVADRVRADNVKVVADQL